MRTEDHLNVHYRKKLFSVEFKRTSHVHYVYMSVPDGKTCTTSRNHLPKGTADSNLTKRAQQDYSAVLTTKLQGRRTMGPKEATNEPVQFFCYSGPLPFNTKVFSSI